MLNGKRKRFAREYMIDMNATQAAIRAGYAERTAYSQGQRLLKNVEVSAFIAKLAKKAGEKVELTAERVLQEIMAIAFFDPAQLFNERGDPLPITEIPEAARRAISGIDMAIVGKDEDSETVRKIRLSPKQGSLELLCRHLGLWKETHEHDVQHTFRMVLQPGDNDKEETDG